MVDRAELLPRRPRRCRRTRSSSTRPTASRSPNPFAPDVVVGDRRRHRAEARRAASMPWSRSSTSGTPGSSAYPRRGPAGQARSALRVAAQMLARPLRRRRRTATATRWSSSRRGEGQRRQVRRGIRGLRVRPPALGGGPQADLPVLTRESLTSKPLDALHGRGVV